MMRSQPQTRFAASLAFTLTLLRRWAVMLAIGPIFTTPASGAPFREVELLANSAHEQVVDVARYLRYETPQGPQNDAFCRDLRAIYDRVSDIQSATLFPQSPHQVQDLSPKIQAVQDRIQVLAKAVRAARRVPARRATQAVPLSLRMARAFAVGRSTSGEPRGRTNLASSDACLRILEDRLATLQRTLQRLATHAQG